MAELYKHNQEIYDGIISAIADGHRKIGYTEATGLGKSFVFAELCNTVFKNKKILYVIPKLAIQDNMYEYSEIQDLVSNVDFATFASFNSEDNAIEYAEKYEVIFVDECHHLLSDIQGRTVDLCGTIISEKVGCYYIGMSATIEIGRVNVFEKYFTKTVYGLDLYDAIVEGLYPKMNYMVAIPDVQDIPEDVRVKYNIDSSKPMLESILSKNKVRKVLVYFARVSEIYENIDYIKSVFDGYKVFVLHYNKDDCNLGTLHEFNEYDGDCVMLSVSMLLEGVHVSGVDCTIIDRNVDKIHTLLQLIGRLYHYGMKNSPLVIDMYNSANLFTKGECTIKSKGYVNKDRFIRDIVNPRCGDYAVIDFVNEYLSISSKNLILILEEDYRGIRAGVYKLYVLGELCGVVGSTARYWYNKHKNDEDFSTKRFIDYCLDLHQDFTSLSIHYCTLKISYRGIEPCNSLMGLAKNLNTICYSTLQNIVHKMAEGKKCLDYKDIIDYVLDIYPFSRRDILVLEKEYKGCKPCKGSGSIAKQMGVSGSMINEYIRRMRKKGVKIDACSLIDYVISRKEGNHVICCGHALHLEKEYRGIHPFKSVSELAEQLGCSLNCLRHAVENLEEIKSTEWLIDYMLDDKLLKVRNRVRYSYKLDREYRGCPVCTSRTGIINYFGLSGGRNTWSLVCKRYNLNTAEKLIDYILDVYIPSHPVTSSSENA